MNGAYANYKMVLYINANIFRFVTVLFLKRIEKYDLCTILYDYYKVAWVLMHVAFLSFLKHRVRFEFQVQVLHQSFEER